jgi:LDH2 family malate/lactate/ureidoglycolate dehydrogenase
MKIKIDEAVDLSKNVLKSFGIGSEEAELITENLIEAELSGRKTHGLVRLISFKSTFDNKKLNVEPLLVDVIGESLTYLHIDGHKKLGFGPIYKSLELAFEKIKSTKIVCVGLKDLGVTGYIGAYARKATEKNLIFIGFNNSLGGLVPYGSIKEMWGTNPITVGIPTNSIPVILDMASSQITWGDLLVAKNEGKQIKDGVAIDSDGQVTTDPNNVAGLLPFFGHKGSGLAFIVELLGGALTGAGVGSQVPGGWGSSYILIDPTMFRSLEDFKKDIDVVIDGLKNSPKMDGFDEIYYPGEKSAKLRQKQLESGFVEISDQILEKVKLINED